jgi:hypothetical protein
MNPHFDPDGRVPRYYPEPDSTPKATPQMTSQKYDYTKCSRAALEKLAEATIENIGFGTAADAVRAEARVKTLAEYDAQIGALLRSEHAGNWGVGQTAYDALRKLVEESRGAK